ncbi:MAG: hypothetical protein ACRDP6_08490, partial [Actinoallomurus sp.]
MRITRPPATVRVRLTALYGGLFLATATALLVTVDLLLQHTLNRKVTAFKVQFLTPGDFGVTRPEGLPEQVPWPPPVAPAGRPTALIRRGEA